MKKKFLLFFSLVAMVLLTIGCQKDSEDSATINEEKQAGNESEINSGKTEFVFTYLQYDLDLENKVKLGSLDAPNTITLAFDYSCKYCKQWMLEVLPQLTELYIDNGEANYVAQSLALLSEKSLLMAKADKYLEEHYPEQLFHLRSLFAGMNEEEGWGTETFIQAIFEENNIDYDKYVKSKDEYDPLPITRVYAKEHSVTSVPTLYINGIRIYDPFDIGEIGRVIKGEIKANDTTIKSY